MRKMARMKKVGRGKVKLEMTVWTNSTEPIDKMFVKGDNSIELLNCLHTSLCTEKRHKKCVEEGKCGRAEPRCDWDKFRMAGYSPTEFRTEMQEAVLRVKAKRIVKAKLKAFLKGCRRYTLTLTR